MGIYPVTKALKIKIYMDGADIEPMKAAHKAGTVKGLAITMNRRIESLPDIPTIEEAGVRELFANPRHPYTRGLIASIPKLSSSEDKLYSIPGAPPMLGAMPEVHEVIIVDGRSTDGTVAVAGSLLLFVVPDGTGRPLLVWKEADRAPWGVIMMFGGGLALAAAITESGLAAWLGAVLAPLGSIPTILLAAVIVALTILITEFASNVATASGIMPVLAALIAATGTDPVLLALPVAMAASWGFMLPSGTGPNALAWATGNIALPRMLKAGLALDLLGVPLLIGIIWAIAALA